jgi:hypothetical protein
MLTSCRLSLAFGCLFCSVVWSGQRVAIGYIDCDSELACIQCVRVAKLHVAIENREFPAKFVEALKRAAKTGIYAIPKAGRGDEENDEDVCDSDGR